MTRQISLAVAAFLSILVALASYRFLLLGLHPSFPEMGGHIDRARVAFLAHVIAAPVALGVGAFQFMARLRARAPGLHRWSGRLYAAAILIAALGALGMTGTANGGLPVQIGFGLLSTFWIATTAIGVRLAMQGRVAAHRPWMIRSFALTFAAVTLRLYLAPMMAAGMSYEAAIPILAWICWVPNLLVAEMLIRRRATVGRVAA